MLNCRIFLVILTLFFATSAHSEADGPDYWRVVGIAKNDTLSIRAEPDARSQKVGEIPVDGKCIENRGCKGGLSFEEYTRLSKKQQAKHLKKNPRWCKVEYQGITGWVAGRYLAEGGCQ